MNVKLSIQRSIASGSRLMVFIQIHLMFYLLECAFPNFLTVNADNIELLSYTLSSILIINMKNITKWQLFGISIAVC